MSLSVSASDVGVKVRLKLDRHEWDGATGVIRGKGSAPGWVTVALDAPSQRQVGLKRVQAKFFELERAE